MYTLRNMKNLTIRGILPPLLAIASLISVNSSAQATCYGYPESTVGCSVNGVAGACVGKTTKGDLILVTGYKTYGCTNPPGSPLASTSICVIRGLGGNDIITSNFGSGGVKKMIVCGGGGNDIMQADDYNDIMLGDAGQDIIMGGGGTNLLYGGTENDTLLKGTTYGSNINWGGAGIRDVCQKGVDGLNVGSECEITLPDDD